MDAASILDKQLPHWETVFTHDVDTFGETPSKPAYFAAEYFKGEGKQRILELGAGQGRDTIYFAQQGFEVYALEYTAAGARAIEKKALALGLSNNISVIRHDVRDPLPFPDGTFDACYSHMLYCMAFNNNQLQNLSSEIRRVLKGGGVNFFTARNTDDKHYGSGIHRGEDLYEIDGFIVHFLSKAKVETLSEGYEVVDLITFEEDQLPKRLFQVILKKLE